MPFATLDKGYRIPLTDSIRYPLPTVSDTLDDEYQIPLTKLTKQHKCITIKTVTTMLEHEVKSKVLTIGNCKGQTVYYAYPKSQQKLTNGIVVERIVRETSLSEGDVKSALVSLSNVVCDALQLGMSVDLAELGSFRLVVPSKMMDTPEEVTVANALKAPKIVFTPKQKMRDAASQVELSIDKGSVKSSTGGGTTTEPGEGETENPLV